MERPEQVPNASPDSILSARIVLIVEDDPAERKLLRLVLEEAGFQCKTAFSAEAALRLLGEEHIDAMLTDLNMPGASGMDLIAEVHSKYPAVAIVMITGVDDIRVGVEAMKRGAEDYLVKPLQQGDAVASLRRALGRKHLETEVGKYHHQLEELVHERTEQLESALREIERSYENTLEALGAAIDLRDSATAGHSHRVAVYCRKMSLELGLSREELQTLARGAWLHDIGKLAIPDAILLKPGALTQEEWRIMRTHVQVGYDLVKRIPFLTDAATIVLTHHERFDGSGYPQGLQKADIPLGARIFAVADTVDAMTSDRPYRLALPFEAAREEIRRGSGTLYDLQVTEIFLRVPIATWSELRSKTTSFESDSV